MRTPAPIRFWSILFGFSCLVLSVSCSTKILRSSSPPRLIPVAVNYLPSLVKGERPVFPSAQLQVLLPVDQRPQYPLNAGGPLLTNQDNTAILGIWGINAEEGVVRVNSNQLGAQRRLKPGISAPPNVPRALFTLSGLPQVVQDALERQFQDEGFRTYRSQLSTPPFHPLPGDEHPAHYAVGCTIEKFSLVSLLRHHEVLIKSPINPHTIDIPIFGPTRAEVSFNLTLYRWPSAEVLWQGVVADAVDDPPLGENDFLYGTAGDILSMAFSRAVGSILITQSLQEILLREPQSQ